MTDKGMTNKGMTDKGMTDKGKGVHQPAKDIKPTPTQDHITVDEMTAARDIFARDLKKALKEQKKSSGSNTELEARIAGLKTEIETLERDIKSSSSPQ
ncbi:hypothetical protein CONLIGDRAFT_712803 [Coniochaeta ligniaria NRRL 30616]|uniref:Uncharacterized protein n=1 Tax=Coniochaeta ligniaria NRRL 30616 TaxID=1408157 RepID=A0A1J7JR91_9PEZI|nr:hypothetical protein CONLIGDRAFT_712803 [Coniochaeta ligniaria NRRL 30616]